MPSFPFQPSLKLFKLISFAQLLNKQNIQQNQVFFSQVIPGPSINFVCDIILATCTISTKV